MILLPFPQLINLEPPWHTNKYKSHNSPGIWTFITLEGGFQERLSYCTVQQILALSLTAMMARRRSKMNDQQLFYRFSTSIRTAAFRTDWSRCSRTSGALAITELQESSLLMTSNRSIVSMVRGRECCTLHIWHSMARPTSCSHVSAHGDVAVEIDSEIPSSNGRYGRNLVLTASR